MWVLLFISHGLTADDPVTVLRERLDVLLTFVFAFGDFFWAANDGGSTDESARFRSNSGTETGDCEGAGFEACADSFGAW